MFCALGVGCFGVRYTINVFCVAWHIQGRVQKNAFIVSFQGDFGSIREKTARYKAKKKQRPKLKILMILDKSFVLSIQTSKIFLIVKCWFYVSCKAFNNF